MTPQDATPSDSPPAAESPPSMGGALLGWALLAILVGYTYFIHQGFGPESAANKAWYTPTSFVFSAPLISELTGTIGSSLAWFVTPALLLAIAVSLTNRSSIARALAISCVLSTICFVYYGVEADQVWTFFHWRASAVLTLMTCAVGFAIAAPWLAGSWLKLGWPLRIAAYLPFVAVVLGFIRNATGTDQNLQFAISPWPAISVFGIGIGAMFVMIILIGLAFGIWGLAAARESGPGRAVLGIALGLIAPGLLLLLGDAAGVFPFGVGPETLIAIAVLCGLAIGVGALLRAGGPDGLRGRSRRLTVGAALLAIPVISGQALARYDYYVTREVLAREVTDALAAYLEKEEIYPDELDELVAGKYLDEIPSPRIGFSFLYDDEFRYRSFGTSFILEFPAPGWVECAYTPPYDDDDEDAGDNEFGVGSYDNPLGEGQYVDSYFEQDAVEIAAAAANEEPVDEAAADDDSLDEAWSCPSAPPQLW
jgi:hypothetical protein